ncbi:MAG: stage V sporulation protein AC [Oscillospiraceae bacterium]|nr:stage V sporulation protein AC [Oscillospiraceae bacterium]MBQ4643136.1 stage V sporulation protein AC [Oscillospiraceae bacterium]
MSISPDEYKKLGEKAVPKTKSLRNLTGAFLIGGGICLFGQFLLNFYLDMGLSTPSASTACSMTLVAVSAVLTGFGVYDKIAKFGGGGTLVPITGFANAVVAPAMEYKSEGFVLGLGVKIFTIAGPVIVYGVLASVVYGLIYWAMGII